jgi:hypothetical protein
MNPLLEDKLAELRTAGRVNTNQYQQMRALLETMDGPRPATTRSGAWILGGIFALFGLVVLMFTPFTHQLDEIKWTLLYVVPAILLFAAFRDFHGRVFARRSGLPLLLLAAFLGVTIISFLLNLSHWRVAERALWMQSGLVAIAWMVSWFASEDRRLRSAFAWVTVVGVVAAIAGLIMYYGVTESTYKHLKAHGAASHWVTFAYTLGHVQETMGPVLSSDFFAEFLACLLPIALAVTLAASPWRWRFTGGFAVLVMGFTLSRTLNRTCIVVGTIALVAVLLVSFVRGKRLGALPVLRRVRWIGIPLVGLVGLFSTVTILFRGSHRLLPWDTLRIIWRAAVGMWLHHGAAEGSVANPISVLFGTGPAGIRLYFNEFRPPDFFDHSINNVTTFAHNAVLDVLVEYGAAGLLVFAALVACTFWLGGRAIMRSRSAERISFTAGALAAFGTMLLVTMFDSGHRWPVGAMTLWIVLGLSIAAIRTEAAVTSTQEDEAEATPRRTRFCIGWFRHPAAFTYAAGVFAILFLVRSVPQGIFYWSAAVENSAGLVEMEIAQESTGEVQTVRLKRARDHFQRAIAMNPSFSTSYYKLAHIYNQLGETDQAIATYENLEKLEPYYSETPLNLGIMYSSKAGESGGPKRLELMEKAASQMRTAARQSLKPGTQFLAGNVSEELAREYAVNGRTADARRARQNALEFYQTLLGYQPTTEEPRKDWEQYAPRATKKIEALKAELNAPAADAQTLAATAATTQPK